MSISEDIDLPSEFFPSGTSSGSSNPPAVEVDDEDMCKAVRVDRVNAASPVDLDEVLLVEVCRQKAEVAACVAKIKTIAKTLIIFRLAIGFSL
jgi:hypothetical protein